MPGDDTLDDEFGRQQMMNNRKLVIGLVLAVRMDDHADALLLRHTEMIPCLHVPSSRCAQSS